MAANASPFYELYRRSSVGRTLMDTLDELIGERRIEPQLAMKILSHFDRSITEVLQDKVKARMTFKGHLDTYRFCDEVWTFLIKDVTFKMDNTSVHADKVKIGLEPTPQARRRQPETVRTSVPHVPPTHASPTTIPMASAPPTSSSATSSSTATAPHPRQALRSRNLPPLPEFTFPPSPGPEDSAPSTPEIPGVQIKQRKEEKENEMAISDLSRKAQWITFALSSGACAAINGVFAKLTTTELTTTFATFLAGLINLEKGEQAFEYAIRAIFFCLNLIFNGIMWTLFTKALSRSPSTTQVAILNTSANFMITAILGLVIFSESLPPLWFLGAGLLVAGNVIIGRREEKEVPVAGEDTHRTSEEGGSTYSDAGEDRALLADDIELETDVEDAIPVKRRDDEDILDLEMPPDESRRVG
ncbi:hypothetical protein V496_03857 [Pseudogymnoascus sp. VKM F-4515 (FW-2607)]|nr:hypothetical protein V496_03857 [Pseudogymnoascus sp. VKM F-4515 (FW-2607)]KFY96486.1 hypothetical protein V498_02662 [Pseudogymnoascus sp. VKM F-4517 (FW-2822)]